MSWVFRIENRKKRTYKVLDTRTKDTVGILTVKKDSSCSVEFVEGVDPSLSTSFGSRIETVAYIKGVEAAVRVHAKETGR